MAKKFPYQRLVLKNGLRVILYPMPSVQSVFLLLQIQIGSRWEKPEKQGITHFLEHLIQAGTPRYPTPNLLSEALENEGISENAGTANNYTEFWSKAPSFKSAKALDFLYQIVFYPLLPTSRITKIRQIIIQEYEDYWRLPENQFAHENTVKRFPEPDLPYLHDSLGNKQSINSFTYSDLVTWKKRFYQPANMILCIAGNYPKDFPRLIEKTFNREKPGKPNSEPRIKPGLYSDFSVNYKAVDREQISFGLSYPTYGWKEKKPAERMVLPLLTRIIGGLKSARLPKKLREEKGLVYEIYCGYINYPWRGHLLIQSSTSRKNLYRTLVEINHEIEKIIKKGVSEQELQRAKSLLNSFSAYEFENPEKAAGYFMQEEASGEPIWLPEKVITTRNRIKIDQVNQEARQILTNKKQINLVLMGKLNRSEIKVCTDLFRP